MKNYMRQIAGAMAAILVLSSSVVALAEEKREGSTTGKGDLDIVEDSDIFDVVMPVVSEEKSVFNYIIDPTGVIEDTDAAKYGPDADFETGQTLFFYVSGGNSSGKNYAHESEKLTVENKGSVDVAVSVTAKVNAVSGITMVDSADDVSSGNAKLYLGFVDDENVTTAKGIKTEVTATATVSGADADDFDIKYVTDGNGGGHYEKELSSSASTFDSYSFWLEGACSADGWGDLANVTLPDVSVVWTVTGEGTAPSTGGSSTGPKVTATSSGLITITGLTAAKNYVKISINGSETIDNCTWTTNAWSETDGGEIKIQLNAKWMSWIAQNSDKTAPIIVYLKDGSTIRTTMTVN